MPWSNQTGGGGGPWGSGSRGPWGSGPQPSGGGSRPPDLEEFLRRSQDRLRNFMPGNLGGRGIGADRAGGDRRCGPFPASIR